MLQFIITKQAAGSVSTVSEVRVVRSVRSDREMGKTRAAMVVITVLLATLLLQANAQGIFVGFYDQSCPQAESIVSQTVGEFNSRDPTTPAALLRLLFHDCFVEVAQALRLLHSCTF